MKRGLYIAFYPVYHVEGPVAKYDIFLINAFDGPIKFRIKGRCGDREFPFKELELASQKVDVYDEIEFDELNNKPVFVYETIRGQTWHEQKLKIKAANFFKKKVDVPLLKGEAHLYLLMDTHPDHYRPDSLSIEIPLRQPGQKGDYVHVNDIEISASLPHEIDLHIERLTTDYQGLSNADKLTMQLTTFESYLQQVLMSNLREIYVVHGVGTGKLKSEIRLMLTDYPGIKSFESGYHPRYGFGATKIILE